ncbi:MAG TPA: hypothetical protein VE844_18370, partial [Gammaproteobacteria bacterium]|nr:hypothetical protein [Gammaproteobacteria bacterium]
MDVVFWLWLSAVVSAEESCTQPEVAFTRALITDGKDHLLEELRCGVVPDRDELPVLLALSDNGGADDVQVHQGVPGRRPHHATHFGRP